MTPTEYLPLAQRTEKIPEGETDWVWNEKAAIASCLQNALQAAAAANSVKRWIVYGKLEPNTVIAQFNPEDMFKGMTSVAQFRIIHALLGKISELGELIECLLPALTTHSSGIVDTVNLQEEMGDDEWYDAILMNVFLISPEAVLQCNIDKLRARYPEKFTEDKAVNRDLEKERQILDAVFTPLEGSK
jgi:hypothetical protein